MKKKDKMTEQQKQAFKNNLLMILINHAGKTRLIGMGELYERVFGETWKHRINDTRRLRTLITELRNNGIAICSVTDHSGGGYYVASAGSELNAYCKKEQQRALKILARVSRMKKIGLDELLGQMRVDLQGQE
jgi:hypothetical protein